MKRKSEHKQQSQQKSTMDNNHYEKKQQWPQTANRSKQHKTPTNTKTTKKRT